MITGMKSMVARPRREFGNFRDHLVTVKTLEFEPWRKCILESTSNELDEESRMGRAVK